MEILDGCQHAIFRSIFVDSIAVVGVRATTIRKLAFSANNSFAFVNLPKFGWNGIWLVIHVSPPIGPFNIMEEDHTSWTQQTPLLNQAQFVEHSKPIVISVDKNAVVSAGKGRECIKAVTFLNRYPSVARILDGKISVEARVNDRIGSNWQCQEFIGGHASAGSDLTATLPTSRPCERNNKVSCKFFHVYSSIESVLELGGEPAKCIVS